MYNHFPYKFITDSKDWIVQRNVNVEYWHHYNGHHLEKWSKISKRDYVNALFRYTNYICANNQLIRLCCYLIDPQTHILYIQTVTTPFLYMSMINNIIVLNPHVESIREQCLALCFFGFVDIIIRVWKSWTETNLSLKCRRNIWVTALRLWAV